MRFGFFYREALRGLSRNATPSLAAILTVLLTALVLGVFIPIVQATTGAANEIRSRVLVDVYVAERASTAEVTELRAALVATPNVRSVEFISKGEALKREQARNRDAFELLGSNPLPDSFRITPVDPGAVTAIVDRLAPRGDEGRRTPALGAIDEVRNREEETEKILSATGVVKGMTAGLAALLVLASIALISNTIRLSVFARRREVEVMRLVGATNWFIRWPFMVEGLVVGFIGGAIAVGVLLAGKLTIVDPLAERFALVAAQNTINFLPLVLILLGCAMAVSAIGSGLTLRRFLQV